MTEVLIEQHRFMRHMGIRKQVIEANWRFAWPVGVNIEEFAQSMRRRCVTCQACEPPNWNTRAPFSATPITARIMTSVAFEIFSLPGMEWRLKMFNAMLLCVDRQIGWMLARHKTKLGMTAEKAAHLVWEDGWDLFGIPDVIRLITAGICGRNLWASGGAYFVRGWRSFKLGASLISLRRTTGRSLRLRPSSFR